MFVQSATKISSLFEPSRRLDSNPTVEAENRIDPALTIASVSSGRRLELRLTGAESLDARLVGPVVQGLRLRPGCTKDQRR